MNDFKLLGVLVTDRQTDRRMDGRTDIGDCRVAFATENSLGDIIDKYLELIRNCFIFCGAMFYFVQKSRRRKIAFPQPKCNVLELFQRSANEE